MSKKRGAGFWLGLTLVGLVLVLVGVFVWNVNQDIKARSEQFRLEREQNKQLSGSPPARPGARDEQPSQGRPGRAGGR